MSDERFRLSYLIVKIRNLIPVRESRFASGSNLFVAANLLLSSSFEGVRSRTLSHKPDLLAAALTRPLAPVP
jgi:hypothetical protein